MFICNFKLFLKLTTSVRLHDAHAGHTQSVAAIRVSVVNQAFCPAQTSVSMDSFVARNPLLLLHSTVMHKRKKDNVTAN
jgi:hypothetical protein